MLILKREGTKGFTIVELLIVVVIIAILAAITLVTYNGVQQRATNTAIIDAVSKSVRMIQGYIAANDKYPLTTGTVCITTSSGCSITGAVVSGSATLDTNISTIGTTPKSIPTSGSDHYGIVYLYYSTRTMNGSIQPVALYYWLQGTGQQCGVSNIADSAGNVMQSSTAGYTASNDSGTGKTLCAVSVPGPAA